MSLVFRAVPRSKSLWLGGAPAYAGGWIASAAPCQLKVGALRDARGALLAESAVCIDGEQGERAGLLPGQWIESGSEVCDLMAVPAEGPHCDAGAPVPASVLRVFAAQCRAFGDVGGRRDEGMLAYADAIDSALACA